MSDATCNECAAPITDKNRGATFYAAFGPKDDEAAMSVERTYCSPCIKKLWADRTRTP